MQIVLNAPSLTIWLLVSAFGLFAQYHYGTHPLIAKDLLPQKTQIATPQSGVWDGWGGALG